VPHNNRDAKGRFLRGAPSANPAGKPAGTRPWTAKLRDQLEAAVPEVVQVVLAAAKAGDPQMARLVLDKSLASRRDDPVHLPGLADMTPQERAQAVLCAVSEGTITPSEGERLLGLVASAAQLGQMQELNARLDTLEHRLSDVLDAGRP